MSNSEQKAAGPGRSGTLRVFRSREEADRADLEQYRSMTPEERLAVVEMLRRQWYKISGGTDEGLRRVVRIIRR